MSWLPAISVLLLADVAALVAIAMAAPIRRHRLRAFRTRRGKVASQIRQRLNTSAVAGRSVAWSQGTDEQSLRLALTDADANVRLTAARLIGERSIGDDLALLQVLSTVDEPCGRLLIGSRPAQDGPPLPELMSIAAQPDGSRRLPAVRLLGTHVDSRSRRALAALLADTDPRIRCEAAAALAASTRLGYPNPLEPAIVNRLIELLGSERVQAVIVEVVDILAYSLDQRVPAALVRLIPSSNGVVRERLIEASALFAHLVQRVTRVVQGARP